MFCSIYLNQLFSDLYFLHKSMCTDEVDLSHHHDYDHKDLALSVLMMEHHRMVNVNDLIDESHHLWMNLEVD